MSQQHDEERGKLPEELRPIFDQLVAEYKFHCLRYYGRELVSYKVLADLVRDGWRPVAPSDGSVVAQGA